MKLPTAIRFSDFNSSPGRQAPLQFEGADRNQVRPQACCIEHCEKIFGHRVCRCELDLPICP